MRHLYSAALYALMPLVLLRLLLRSLKTPAYRRRLAERWGCVPALRAGPPVLWVHAASLGEVQAAAPLVEALLRDYPGHRLLLTTTTPSGSERVRALFGDRVDHSYVPWDLPGAVRRFLRRVRPRLLVLMETELWPNLVHCAGAGGAAVVLANARLSRRSAAGYARGGRLVGDMLAHLDRVAAQSAADGERFLALGLPPRALRVTGSLKFEFRVDGDMRAAADRLRAALVPAGRPVLLAASTHPPEEADVLAAFAAARADAPHCLLLWAPRHPERARAFEARCRAGGLSVARRSAGDAGWAGAAVLVVDTLGELPLLTGLATLAFVGGSLCDRGGHNPLEAVAWGVPVLCGPHRRNFASIYRPLEEAGALCTVTDGAALAAAAAELLADPVRRADMGRAGCALLESGRGALRALLAQVDEVLESRGAGEAI